jgi:DNA modification methylase
MPDLRNQIICGDCVEILRQVKEPFADLVFADPPFNIGYAYDKYHDRKASDRYVDWTKEWIAACTRVLKPHGSFYIAIGDDYAAHVRLIADAQGLVLRNWIIWHYSFGQQTKNKFARAHTHVFYFVKDRKHFTFNDEIVRVISDRQKKYADRRANPAGKMPDDVWNEYPRVCGTFDERTGFPCQMPESLLARIIRVSSHEGDWVLDPFCGSGTTAAVAHKLGRVYTTIDLSEQYVAAAQQRISMQGQDARATRQPHWPEQADLELRWLYSENKIPIRQLSVDRKLLSLFTRKLNHRLQDHDHYTVDEVWKRLKALEPRLSPLDKVSAIQPEVTLSEE